MRAVPDQYLPNVRWEILRTLNVGGRLGATDTMLLNVVVANYMTATREAIRDEMVYLEDRRLIEITRHDIDPWVARLTRYGRDIVDYQVECRPGIKRPPRLAE